MAWVVVVAGLLGGGVVDADPLPYSGVPADDWSALFQHSVGWSGADGIYSIPLNGDDGFGSDAPRTLFVFSDTFVGEVAEDGSRLPGTTIVNNTLALLEGTEPVAEAIRFAVRRDATGAPMAMVAPRTPNSQPDDWYWLMDGVALEGRVHVFALRMEYTEGPPGWNFAIAGVSLLTWEWAGAAPGGELREGMGSGADAEIGPGGWRFEQRDTPFFLPEAGDRAERYLGQAILDNRPQSGAPDGDGFIYVYGCRSDPLNKRLVAGRVRPEEFDDLSAWRYWDGEEWGSDLGAVAPLASRLSSEHSVTALPDGRYAVVFQMDGLGRDTAMRIGPSPIGPFAAAIPLYRAPEPDQYPNAYPYNAKAHPHLSTGDTLLISYNVNTLDFRDHFRFADIYRPRFIRVPLRLE
jgi:hypothetical protein